MAKKAKRRETDGELNITSMMDMMTIILCFLLKSMSATEITVTPSDNLKLPISSSLQDPAIAVSVVVAKDRILVADKPILNLTSFADENNPGEVLVGIAKSDRQGMAIPALHEAFTEQAKAAKKFGSIREDMEFKGRILLQIDKDIPFSLLRDVMYNAGQAQFGEFEFVVVKGSE